MTKRPDVTLVTSLTSQKVTFKNIPGSVQYRSYLFGIDASSNPTKFKNDCPSGSAKSCRGFVVAPSILSKDDTERRTSCPTDTL